MSNSSPSLKAGVTGFQQPVESIKQFITGSVFPYTRHIFQILPEAVFVFLILFAFFVFLKLFVLYDIKEYSFSWLECG